MEINYPEFIQNDKIKLKFSIGDKVKRDAYDNGNEKVAEMRFIVASIQVDLRLGVIYRGVGEIKDKGGVERDICSGKEEELELVEKGAFTKEEV